MKRSLAILLSLLSFAATSARATTEQTKRFKIYASDDPISARPFSELCPWPGADGEPVLMVSLDASVRFFDPLPAGSIVTQIDTRVSLLPSPQFAGITADVSLNATGFAPVFDPAAVIGTFAPPTQQTGCPNPSFGFPGGVTQFLSVSVPGIRDTAGLSKYMYVSRSRESRILTNLATPYST